ncbi:MAG: hypothetical protein KatS3mg040_1317 [Candidatus Kapaibacterium sp.]|nr:MAG: hypothetical protein KatS3mg040_1317 [Candidatus Kapabacteria bacterium]
MGSLLASCLVAHASADTSAVRDSVTPLGALWRSAVLPGWGQLYYGSVPKAALFFGASAAVGGIVAWNNTRFLDADRRYQQYDSTDGRKTLALREREFYRDQRDVAALWLVAIYALNLMDAYVGGEMAGFRLDSSTSVQLLPFAGGIGLIVQWQLPGLRSAP